MTTDEMIRRYCKETKTDDDIWDFAKKYGHLIDVPMPAWYTAKTQPLR